jgi:adenine-specific DNA methylase
MKFIDEVSDDKLRGGFYTPSPLVLECYSRIAELAGCRALRLLEPSAGDGAFVRSFPQAMQRFGLPKADFTCVELVEEEARKCEASLRSLRLDGRVLHESFFMWARNTTDLFDAAVGNPPFVRYQFVPKGQRDDADHIFASRGKEFDGVANLWIPFVLISMEFLRDGGAFSFVLPGELFATKSAGIVRSELIQRSENLRVDLYQRGYFPKILQDVIILSGRRTPEAEGKRRVEFVDHGVNAERRWSHIIPDSTASWTRYLLSDAELSAYVHAGSLPEIHELGEVASIGVSIVTGANDFFTGDDALIQKYGLRPWAKPLLARTSDCPGLIFTAADQRAARKLGRKAWVLDFEASSPDPMQFPKPREYLRLGEKAGLPKRYKCRIREPWYRVPDIRYDTLMLSKRAHQFHRLLLNKAKVHTTDTIYRGRMRPLYVHWQESLVAAFHNSLTILSSEIEGRTYGGGVLELVPSEIGRLIVPIVEMSKHLPKLDEICRANGGQLDADDSLILATDALLMRQLPQLSEYMPTLIAARDRLRQKRFLG